MVNFSYGVHHFCARKKDLLQAHVKENNCPRVGCTNALSI
jgi:hypothetical protein